MKKTTITLSKETKDRLDEKKIHPRESYEEVLVKLLNGCVSDFILLKKIDDLKIEIGNELGREINQNDVIEMAICALKCARDDMYC